LNYLQYKGVAWKSILSIWPPPLAIKAFDMILWKKLHRNYKKLHFTSKNKKVRIMVNLGETELTASDKNGINNHLILG